jgi:hypothetical protein
MAAVAHQRDADTNPNTVAALGLRRAALRGMLTSPLIDTEEQKELREELVSELQTVGQSMAKLSSRNPVEVCAKLDILGEEYRPGGSDTSTALSLIASIRRDVSALMPRASSERQGYQSVRSLQASRPVEAASSSSASEGSSKSGA